MHTDGMPTTVDEMLIGLRAEWQRLKVLLIRLIVNRIYQKQRFALFCLNVSLMVVGEKV